MSVVLVHHRALGAPVYVGPFTDVDAAIRWIKSKERPNGHGPQPVLWGIVTLQDPGDPTTPDWAA